MSACALMCSAFSPPSITPASRGAAARTTVTTGTARDSCCGCWHEPCSAPSRSHGGNWRSTGCRTQDDAVSALRAQVGRGASLANGDFDQPARAHEGEGAANIHVGVHPAYRQREVTEIDRASIPGGEIRDRVSEPVDRDDLTNDRAI